MLGKGKYYFILALIKMLRRKFNRELSLFMRKVIMNNRMFRAEGLNNNIETDLPK